MAVFVVCMDRWMVCGRRRVMVNGWVDGWMGGCILQQIIVKKSSYNKSYEGQNHVV